MQSSLYKKLSIGALSLSSCLFSGPAETKAMEKEKAPPAAVSVLEADEQTLEEILGDRYSLDNLQYYEKLQAKGLSNKDIALIHDERLKDYAKASEYAEAKELALSAYVQHALGEDNAWLRASTWLEELDGVSRDTAEKLIELHQLRQLHDPGEKAGIRGQGCGRWCALIDKGVPLKTLVEMEHATMISLHKDFESGRVPEELIAFLSTDFEAHSRAAAEADPDFDKGVEFARTWIRKEINSRDHVFRSSTDYEEDISQFDAIKDPHQIFLIKQYIEYFKQPETIVAMSDLFDVVPEEEKEEKGGVILSDKDGIRFLPIAQYLKDSEARGNERNTFATPPICDFINHLGILHTHPGGPAVAGPSGYAKPHLGPGKYFPGGDTYCLSVANEKNPRIIEVVVTELSTGRHNIDIFFRDVEVHADGSIKNTDPIRVIDLGVYELPEPLLSKKLEEKAALDARTRGDGEEQESDTSNQEEQEDETTAESEKSLEKQLDELIARNIPLIDSWPEAALPRVVTGDLLEQRFSKLRELREVDLQTAPYFLELMVYGAKPEQLVDVHRYHISGLTTGFRNGRYPAAFIQDLGKSHVRYSAEAAIADPDASKGSRWAREHLLEKLADRDHLHRLGRDYDEGLDTLRATDDKYMIFLIKRYVDFFDNPKNWEALEHLFRESESRIPERGGLMLHRDGKIQFVEIEQSLERRSDPERYGNSYQPSHLQYNAVALGGLHTHPMSLHADPRSNGDPREISGPSGKAHLEPGMDKYAADTGALRYFNQGSPFGIEVVISQIGDRKYNVDIYYRDVTETTDGKAQNDAHVSVLDIGVFEPSTMAKKDPEQEDTE